MRRYNPYFGGPQDIPVPIRPIGLTDRIDGTAYWLSYDGTHVTLNDSIPRDCEVFGPYDGPYVPFDAVRSARLFVEGGDLGAEWTEHVMTRPVYATPLAKTKPDRGDPLVLVKIAEDFDVLPRLSFEVLPYP